jgi:hypothetical protein
MNLGVKGISQKHVQAAHVKMAKAVKRKRPSKK